MTAAVARLGGRKEPVHLDDTAVAPLRLIFQHPNERSQRRIAERLSQLGFHNAMEVQVFDAERIVEANEF